MRWLKNPSWISSQGVITSQEFRLLAPVVLIIGLFTLFVKLAGEVQEGETHGLDAAILLAFRTTNPSDPIGPQWLEIAVADITSLGGYAVLSLISLLVTGYLLLIHRPASAALVIISGVGAMLLNNTLKVGFDRPRPDLVAHLADVHSLSFPSGHAMLSAVIYLTLGTLLARSQKETRHKVYILACAMLLTGVIGVSRIYLGVHWPSDVLAGWCLGGAWALLCLKVVTLCEVKSKRLPI